MNVFIFAIFCSIAALAFAYDTLEPGKQLDIDNQVISEQGRYRLYLQNDGNLVIYSLRNGNFRWFANTKGSGATKAIMQTDGQFVLQTALGETVWSTYTRDAGSILKLQDDNILIVYSPKGYVVWNSATGWGATTTV
jgi:hypothetical protein